MKLIKKYWLLLFLIALISWMYTRDIKPAPELIENQPVKKQAVQSEPPSSSITSRPVHQQVKVTGPLQKIAPSTRFSKTINPAAAEVIEQMRLAKDGLGEHQPINQTNPQVQSLREAFETGQHPERISILKHGKAFDKNAWLNDKKYRTDYLSVVEPGRAFLASQEGEGVGRVERVAPFYQYVTQGADPIVLAIKTAPGAPATFTSTDAGAFGNGLTSQTVQADSSGLATVEFFGVAGTAFESKIVAASPMVSGLARFIIFTKVKK